MDYATNMAEVSSIDTQNIHSDSMAMIDGLLYFPAEFSNERIIRILDENFAFCRQNSCYEMD